MSGVRITGIWEPGIPFGWTVVEVRKRSDGSIAACLYCYGDAAYKATMEGYESSEYTEWFCGRTPCVEGAIREMAKLRAAITGEGET